jgi:Na+/proline symporter
MYLSDGLSATPEIISGVLASSIKMESTSSMMQKLNSLSTKSSGTCAKLSLK